jgi:hypothetical protein
MEFFMRRVAAAFAVLAVAGCASGPTPSGSVVRARAPANYQATIHNYFDFTTPSPESGRRLAFGDPEMADCSLSGGSGFYRGWVVPVLFDTSKEPVAPAPAKKARVTSDAAAKRTRAQNADAAARRVRAETDAAEALAAPAPPGEPQTVSMAEVSITANKYFFWFGSDTIAAVTRRRDLCP